MQGHVPIQLLICQIMSHQTGIHQNFSTAKVYLFVVAI